MKTENRELATFFTLTFAVSWLLWLPGVLRSNGFNLPEWVGIFGVFVPLMPSLMAFMLTGRSEGRRGVAELARRGIRFDFNPIWVLPVILIPGVIALLTRYILQATGNEVLAGWEAPTLVSGIVTFFVILLIAILYHTLGNTASALLPPFFATEFGRWTNFAILLVITAAVILYYGPKKLMRTSSVL